MNDLQTVIYDIAYSNSSRTFKEIFFDDDNQAKVVSAFIMEYIISGGDSFSDYFDTEAADALVWVLKPDLDEDFNTHYSIRQAMAERLFPKISDLIEEKFNAIQSIAQDEYQEDCQDDLEFTQYREAEMMRDYSPALFSNNPVMATAL